MDRILGTLTPREQTVIRLRFGIGQDQARTLEQVGQQLSVTRERIRQIEAKGAEEAQEPGGEGNVRGAEIILLEPGEARVMQRARQLPRPCCFCPLSPCRPL